MKYILSIFLCLFFLQCENLTGGNIEQTKYAVLSTLFNENQRMLLLLKGTYASDNPLQFTEYSSGSGALYVDTEGDGADPTMDIAGVPAANDLPIYIDIGEVRISSKYQEGFNGPDGITDTQATQKFWDYIAPTRQVYCTFPPYSIQNTSCHDTGLLRIQDFFNGNGVIYPSSDPTGISYNADFSNFGGTTACGDCPVQYYYAGVYFRSFVTGWAREQGGLKIDTRFDNFEVTGSNLLFRNNYRPGTNDAEKETLTPLMFPLFHSIAGGQREMEIRGGYDPYILEMRMNIKENLMVHSYTTPFGFTQTMVGFSDWRFEDSGSSDMGGNLLLRPRIIYPETASSLAITGGTKSTTHYYAIYRSDEIDFEGQLPLAASPVQDGTTNIKYIHEGEYTLQCRGDLDRVDGYPETLVRDTTFMVESFPFRQTVTVELACP
ncbi:MAG: hypothetical protein AAF518_08605 [Spirochaetota bacterium]